MVVEVDLSVIKRNIKYIRHKTTANICFVVKANAYGHGLIETSRALEKHVDFLAVATEEEALELCESGIRKKILVLGCARTREIMPKNVVLCVNSLDAIKSAAGRAREVSIAVNTGMNRIGCRSDEVKRICVSAWASGLKVHGVFSHFYDETSTKSCADQFDEFLNGVLPIRDSVKNLHICASNCLTLPESYHLDMVRVGLAAYGYGYEGVKPAMKIYAEIVQILALRRGDHIGYGNKTVERDMTVATIRAGYGDGFRRKDNAFVSINNNKCSVVGNICMDMCMVDVTNIDCKIGDKAYILGEKVHMSDIIVSHITISHEVLTMINGRPRRIYIGK